MPARAKASKTQVSKSSFAPATKAISHLPSWSAEIAASRATNEEEHAVSYTEFGPWKLNT